MPDLRLTLALLVALSPVRVWALDPARAEILTLRLGMTRAEVIANLTAQSHQGIAVPAPRDARPSLEPSAVVKMADALQAEPAPGMVDIWCPSISCTALAADLDDAFQILNWEDQMQSERIDSNDDPGVSVGGGAQEVVRAKLAGALSDALGQPVAIVDMPPDAPLSVIIGRHKP